MPVSRMLLAKVRRSTIAAHSRGSVKVFVQPEKDSLLVMATLDGFLPIGEDLEQHFRAAAVQFHVAEFVNTK